MRNNLEAHKALEVSMSVLSGMPFTAIKASSLDDPNQVQHTASIVVASAPSWAPHFPVDAARIVFRFRRVDHFRI
jgi:hypothetical protein